MISYGYTYHKDGMLVKLKAYDTSGLEFKFFTKVTNFLTPINHYKILRDLFCENITNW
jgi:hypothetical protein